MARVFSRRELEHLLLLLLLVVVVVVFVLEALRVAG